jgi:hypothetical protein
MTGFIEDDYKVPTTSGYFRFQEGENRIRILGSFIDKTAIRGMEYWTTDDKGVRKPNRVHEGDPIPVHEIELNPKTGKPEMPKYFWAFPVWSFRDSRIQIMELTQKTVINAIKSLAENNAWGDPENYTISIVKGTDNGKVTYSVLPEPKSEMPHEAGEALFTTPVRIEALFSGLDPFEMEKPKATK